MQILQDLKLIGLLQGIMSLYEVTQYLTLSLESYFYISCATSI